jgi:hypothetical protein
MLNRVQLGVVAYYLAFTIKGVVWIHFNGGFEAHNMPLLLAHTMWEGTVILGCAFLLTRAIDGLFGDRQAGEWNESRPVRSSTWTFPQGGYRRVDHEGRTDLR